MKTTYLLASAALLLAACGQGAEAPTTEEPAAPADLLSQIQAMGPEAQPVFAYQQLIAYQQAHPEVTPACTAVRETIQRRVPANVDPASAYAPFSNAVVFSIQCGELRSRARYDPSEHWLIAFTPGAAEPTVVNCANGNNDRCPQQVPTVAAAPAPAAPATP